ncbi:MAG TPA: hypothetical protein VGD62_04260 [Acidobacteriaceae bacterium]
MSRTNWVSGIGGGIGRSLVGLALVAAWSGSALAQGNSAEPLLNADEIMARVAANQDRAQAERARYVYVQHVHIISRKGKSIQCEETTDARVTPTEKGSHAELLKLDGRVLHGGKYLAYTTLLKSEAADQGQDTLSINIGDDDREMVESLRADLTNNPTDGARDGINAQLFPLTSKAQRSYLFQLVGRERMNGRNVVHIDFRPKDKDEFDWKGTAYIDAEAYQPVVVSTAMARNVPLAVRTLLGTSVPGLGFSVNYAPQPDGVWFPVSFGTEFKIHVLFFFNREITVDAESRDFEKTHVTARMVDGGAAPQ